MDSKLQPRESLGLTLSFLSSIEAFFLANAEATSRTCIYQRDQYTRVSVKLKARRSQRDAILTLSSKATTSSSSYFTTAAIFNEFVCV